jgi:3-methyladenine DNA glycosylase/8-oxoguanine DNA glycosylase
LRLTHTSRFEIVPVAPFDFRLTVKRPAGWSLFNAGEIYQDGTLWTATRLLGTLVGLKLKFLGTVEKPRMLVTIFTHRPLPARKKREMERSLVTLTGADQDLKEFYLMAKRDEILRHTVEDLYGMHDTQTAYLFNSVVLSICLQMAKMDRSMKMMAAVTQHYGDGVEFDGREIVVEPSADRIAKLDPKEFAKRCNLGYRAKYLVAAAKVIALGFPDTLDILTMPPEEAKERLMELPGVGDYAADIINPHGGFPIDAWSVDVFGKLFFGKEPDDKRAAIEEVKHEGVRRWGDFAWLAFFYVSQDLENLSKRLRTQLRLQ